MKKLQTYGYSLLVALLATSMPLCLTACDDDDDDDDVAVVESEDQTSEDDTTTTDEQTEEQTSSIEFTSFSPETVKAGDALTITGLNLDSINVVAFPLYGDAGYTYVEVTPTSATELSVTVPKEAATGIISICVSESGEIVKSVSHADTLIVTSPTVVARQAKTNIAAGDEISIEGADLDLVESITLTDGTSLTDFTVSDDYTLITFTAPSAQDAGTIVLVAYSGEEIGALSAKISTATQADGVVTWEGSQLIDWGEPETCTLTDFSDGGIDWSLVTAGQIIKITYTKGDLNAWWGCVSLRLNDADWSNLSETGGQIDISASGTVSYTLTQEDIDALVANNGLLFTGYNITITKITIADAPEEGEEEVLWEGNEDLGDWGGFQSLAWGNYTWSNVSADQILTISCTMGSLAEWGAIKLFNASGSDDGGWGDLPDNNSYTYIDSSTTEVSFTFTQDDVESLATYNGLVIQGYNAIITKITLQ